MSSAARITKPPKAIAPLPPAIPPLPVRRFTVDEYHKMIETGILKSGDRFELIHGWIVRKMTINPPHTYSVNAVQDALRALQLPKAHVRGQQPVTTSDSEPEPDVVLAVGSKDDYKVRNPRPSEVLLLVEVADSSLHEDRTTKLELYAASKIAVYWIVNLVDRRIEVYTEPRGGKNPAYKLQTNYGPDDTVPVVVAGKQIGRIPVKELLP